MKLVIQRSQESSVSVNNKIINEIDKGLVMLVGFTTSDTYKDIEFCVKKIVNLRIFDDENGVMNKSIMEINGSILSISQFTLYANPYKGNRPSYIEALNGKEAIKLYEKFNDLLNEFVPTKAGIFGADMLVNIKNDGPVTILIDSKEK